MYTLGILFLLHVTEEWILDWTFRSQHLPHNQKLQWIHEDSQQSTCKEQFKKRTIVEKSQQWKVELHFFFFKRKVYVANSSVWAAYVFFSSRYHQNCTNIWTEHCFQKWIRKLLAATHDCQAITVSHKLKFDKVHTVNKKRTRQTSGKI